MLDVKQQKKFSDVIAAKKSDKDGKRGSFVIRNIFLSGRLTCCNCFRLVWTTSVGNLMVALNAALEVNGKPHKAKIGKLSSYSNAAPRILIDIPSPQAA